MPVGYSQSGLTTGTWATANWFTDAWLSQFLSADIALFNFGITENPIAQRSPSASVTWCASAPFKNVLVQVEVTGAEGAQVATLWPAPTRSALADSEGCSGQDVVNARDAAGQVDLALDSGAPFDDAATYTVIAADFLYYGGAKYDFASYDPTPTDLGAHMRDPVISWTTGPEYVCDGPRRVQPRRDSAGPVLSH